MYRNDMADGVMTPAMERFAVSAESNLDALADHIARGAYVPGRLTPVDIPKDDGDSRTLLIPRPVDRVFERAITEMIMPLVDHTLTPASHGYRPGRGVGTACRRLASLRDEGLAWVALSDIADCFDTIPVSGVLSVVRILIPPDLAYLVGALLDERRRPRMMRNGLGLPQGGSLSPLLSNLYLDQFDRALMTKGIPVVRYADDMAFPAASKEEARAGLEQARSEASRLGLRLKGEGTEIASYAQGFTYLGEDFNLRYPAFTAEHGRDSPERRVLYVGTPGAYVKLAGGRLVVSRKKSELLSIPSGKVSRIVAAGAVTLAPGLRTWALSSGISVVFLAGSGMFQGNLESHSRSKVARRRKQFDVTSSERPRVSMGSQFVVGKISNQRALLLRYNRRARAKEVSRSVRELDHLEALLPDAATPSEVMGIEGAAARTYFMALSALVPEELGFTHRNRRPPLDVVNAALSYGYGVLLGEGVTALAIAGLDASVGFLHGDADNRPSLALDLIEEFRPLIVDTVVLELTRRGTLGLGQGHRRKGRAGVFLTDAGRKTLLSALEDRLLTKSVHVPTGRKGVTHRGQIQYQAYQIASCVDTGSWEYLPVGWR